MQNTIKHISIGGIKTALSVLPIIGTALDELFFEVSGRIKNDRMEKFVQELSKVVSKLEEAKIDVNYLKSEDFYDFSVDLFSKAVRTNSQLKRLALSRVLCHAIKDRLTFENDLTSIFARYIDELTPFHLRLFMFLKGELENLQSMKTYQEILDRFATYDQSGDIDKYQFRLYARDLEMKTLVRFKKDLGDFVGGGGFATDERAPAVYITSIGERFLMYLMSRDGKYTQQHA